MSFVVKYKNLILLVTFCASVMLGYKLSLVTDESLADKDIVPGVVLSILSLGVNIGIIVLMNWALLKFVIFPAELKVKSNQKSHYTNNDPYS